MIISNHCKEPSEVIQCVLHKKLLTPILYTKLIWALSKYCENCITQFTATYELRRTLWVS